MTHRKGLFLIMYPLKYSCSPEYEDRMIYEEALKVLKGRSCRTHTESLGRRG